VNLKSSGFKKAKEESEQIQQEDPPF